MDSRLYTFLMVDKTKNYTRASENLNLTQPAVYKQIKYLENYYGVNLFIKDGKRLKLTEEGKVFRNYANQIINIHKELKEKLKEKDLTREKYRIGATMTIGAYVLPRTIYKYMGINNNVDISLTVNNTNIILKKLLNREISMAMVEGPFDKTKFKYRKFKDDELVLIGPNKGRLSKIEEISLEEILKENFILREKESGTREIIESIFISKGYSKDVLKNHMEINSINGIKTLVEDGVGLSILSKESIKREIDLQTLRMIPIKGITIIRELNFVYIYHKDIDFIDKFIEFSLRKEVEKMIIKILGAGCDKCDKSYDNAMKAIAELHSDATVEKVEDLVTMMKYGVMSTPGIVVDEEVIMVGRIPGVEDFKKMIEK